MKILNVFNHYLESGGEAHAVRAISESLSRIFDLESCEFFTADWAGRHTTAAWKQAVWMLRNPRSLKKIREQNQHFQPNLWLVHNVFPVGSAAIYTEATRLGVPIVQYLHNFRPFSVNGSLWVNNQIEPGGLSKNYWKEIRYGGWQNSRLKTAWLAAVLSLMHLLGSWRSVKAWIAISDFLRNKFITAGVPAEDIFTLRHFWRPQPVFSEGEGAHYLYLGRLIEAKGILSLLDAWEILEREGSSAPPLVIGGSGPLHSAVAARVERMRSVRFAGELQGPAKHEAIANARALIVPSLWWEPLGLVVYEAYDYCRPVLAASSGGLPEILLDRQTGFLHQPGNARQLAGQVRQLEADKNARREMGKQGRLWLEKNASEAQWQEGFSKIAAHAIARRP